VRLAAALEPLFPGPYGYELHQIVNTDLEEERTSRLLNQNTRTILRSARSTRRFDEFDNLTYQQTEVSPDPLLVDGSIAAAQVVYSSTQQFSQSQTPLTDAWLISRYPQYTS
jgi:hypothetical protein